MILTPVGGVLFAAGWPALLVLLGVAVLLRGVLGSVFRLFSPGGARAVG